MTHSYLQILNPNLCLIINILIQVISFRCIKNIGLLKSIFLGFISGFIILFILEIYISFRLSILPRDFLSLFVVNFLIYSLLGFCYSNFITLGETARRIRILRELYDYNEGLSMEEILERYNAKEIIKMRISRLIKNGQVIYKDKKYYLNGYTILLITKIIIFIKMLILGKRSVDL